MTEGGVVIVGANLAGVRTAAALRRAGYAETITVLGAEDHVPYERPPLSKSAGPPTLVPLFPERFYESERIDLRLGVRVARIDRAGASVVSADGTTFAARAIVLATGGHARRFSIPGADLSGIHVLRTLDDAAALDGDLAAGGPYVVIGGGLLGAEAAAAASARGCEVTWLEVRPAFLEHALPRPIAACITSAARAAGITMLGGAAVAGFSGGERVEQVLLADGRRVAARTVLVAIGISPADELARDAGIDVDDGIVVDQACRTSVSSVWAAGDVARRRTSGGRGVRHEHWQAAEEQAGIVASDIVGRPAPAPMQPWFWSDLAFGAGAHHVEVGGRFDGASVIARGEAPPLTVLGVVDDKVVGVASIDRPRDVRAGIRLIESALSFDGAVLADPSSDLVQLARAKRPPPG